MTSSHKFHGQVLSIYLEAAEDRERLERIFKEKYRGQMTFSSYGKMAIYKLLEDDEFEYEEEGKGRGAHANQAGHASDTRNVTATTEQRKRSLLSAHSSTEARQH